MCALFLNANRMLLNLMDEFLLRKMLSANGSHTSYEILGFAEAGSGHTLVLLVRQSDPIARSLLDLMGRGVISDAEAKDLRHDARYGRHDQFALPGLANPPFPGDLLYIARAFA
jgi:hypothetical protein